MRRLWYHGKVDTMVPGKDRQQAIGLEEMCIRDRPRRVWREKARKPPRARAAT